MRIYFLGVTFLLRVIFLLCPFLCYVFYYKKNTVFFKQTFKVLKMKVVQLCLTLCNSMDCSLPGSSIHGVFQARILEWFAIPFPDIYALIRTSSSITAQFLFLKNESVPKRKSEIIKILCFSFTVKSKKKSKNKHEIINTNKNLCQGCKDSSTSSKQSM